MRLMIGVCTCLAVIVPNSAHETLIVDGDFLNWQYSSTTYYEPSPPPPSSPYNPSASVTRQPTGGKPDANLKVTTNTAPFFPVFTTYGIFDTALGNSLKTDYATNDVLQGADFTLKLDRKSGDGAFGQGQAIHLLVEQNGALYSKELGVTFLDFAQFSQITLQGNFTAANFSRLLTTAVDNSQHPVFDGSASTRFGFSVRNTISGNLTQYYDNFELSFTPTAVAVSAVPEPSSIGLLAGFAASGLGLSIWRRKFRPHIG